MQSPCPCGHFEMHGKGTWMNCLEGAALPMQYLWWKWWRGWWGRRSRGVEQWKWTFVGADLEETTIQKTEEKAEWWWRRRRWRSWDCNCWNTSWYPEKNITPVWEDGVNNQMLCLLCYYSYVMFYIFSEVFCKNLGWGTWVAPEYLRHEWTAWREQGGRVAAASRLRFGQVKIIFLKRS